MGNQGCYQVNKANASQKAYCEPLKQKIMADVELYALEAKCDALRHKFNQIPTTAPELKNAIGDEVKKACEACERAKREYAYQYGDRY